MTSITVESARGIAIAVAVALVALMLAIAFVVKNVTAKLLSVLVIGGLALGVWTQRSSLEDCAKRVKDRGALGDRSDVTCSFLGSDINVPPATVP